MEKRYRSVCSSSSFVRRTEDMVTSLQKRVRNVLVVLGCLLITMTAWVGLDQVEAIASPSDAANVELARAGSELDRVVGEGASDKIQGKAKKDIGTVKRNVGKVTGQVEGVAEEVQGRAQQDFGRTQQAIDEATDATTDAAEGFVDSVKDFLGQ